MKGWTAQPITTNRKHWLLYSASNKSSSVAFRVRFHLIRDAQEVDGPVELLLTCPCSPEPEIEFNNIAPLPLSSLPIHLKLLRWLVTEICNYMYHTSISQRLVMTIGCPDRHQWQGTKAERNQSHVVIFACVISCVEFFRYT